MKGFNYENMSKGPIINTINKAQTQYPLTSLSKKFYYFPVLYFILPLLEIAVTKHYL